MLPAAEVSCHRASVAITTDPEATHPAVGPSEKVNASVARPAATAQRRHPPSASGATTAKPTTTATSMTTVVVVSITMRIYTSRVNSCQVVYAGPMDAVAEELTIDELAQLMGLPSSTIRLYRTKGLLPPPQRRGRSAFYGPGHVARVDLIGRLQERGFSLAAIAELVQQWEEGRSL